MIYNLFWALGIAATVANASPFLENSARHISSRSDPQHMLQKRDACGQYEGINARGYTLNNNMWGYNDKHHGNQKQCTVLERQRKNVLKWHTHFSWDRFDGGVKSFANARLNHLPFQIGNAPEMPTSIDWDLTCANNGRFGASVVYDLFMGPARNRRAASSKDMKATNELMVWPGQYGGNAPIAQKYDPYTAYRKGLSIDGVDGLWDLYKGPNSGTTVHSFIPRNGKGEWEDWKVWNGNLKPFVKWLADNGEVPKSYWLFQTQFGTEPTYGIDCTFWVNHMSMSVG